MTDDDVLARLRARTTTTETCWLWDGATTAKGYGRISVGGSMRRVHRVAYAILGPEPLDPAKVLHHRCENRRCWNPQHLTQVTSRDNTLAGTGPSARHARTTSCPQGHPYTAQNTRHARGRRHCRTCDRHRSQRRRTQHHATNPTNATPESLLDHHQVPPKHTLRPTPNPPPTPPQQTKTVHTPSCHAR